MPNRLRKQGLVALSAVLIALFPIAALAAPGDILFSDNFSVDTGSGDPIVFVDGAISSGLSYNFASDVTFSNQVGGGAPFTYIPVTRWARI